MDYQDWKPLVIKKKVSTKEKKESEIQKAKESGNLETISKIKHSGVNATKIENMIEKDDKPLTVPTVSHDLKIKIQQTRLSKKLKQEDLARLSNLPVDVIKRYENGTAVVDQKQLSAIGKVLGIHLSLKS